MFSVMENAMDQKRHMLCPGCGVHMEVNAANMCLTCLSNEVDLTDGLSKSSMLHWCRGCNSYHMPPDKWVQCELESRELLAVCLKKLKGLNKEFVLRKCRVDGVLLLVTFKLPGDYFG